MVTGKKLALWGCLGCGGFVLLIIILFAGGVGFLVYQGVQFGKGLEQAYREVAVGYQSLDQQYPFELPEGGVMEEERLRSFVAVRREIAVFASERFQEIEQTGERIEEQMERPGVMTKFRGAMTIKEIVGLAVNMAADIGREHIRLLGDTDMSAKEYQWLTFVYLGTLAKAGENNAINLAGHWAEYLEAFESARKRNRDFNINLGEKQIRGSDMNQDRLLWALDKAVYDPKNAELVRLTVDELLPVDRVATLDFIALHLDRIIEDMTKGSRHGDVDIKPIPEKPGRETEIGGLSTDSP